jgi:hypothetical protein
MGNSGKLERARDQKPFRQVLRETSTLKSAGVLTGQNARFDEVDGEIGIQERSTTTELSVWTFFPTFLSSPFNRSFPTAPFSAPQFSIRVHLCPFVVQLHRYNLKQIEQNYGRKEA